MNEIILGKIHLIPKNHYSIDNVFSSLRLRQCSYKNIKKCQCPSYGQQKE
jgi:hypothetical protein